MIAAVILLPIVFTVFASFMSPDEVALNYGEMSLENGFTPLHLFPDKISLSGYREVLLETPRYLMQFWISLGICLAICVGFVDAWSMVEQPIVFITDTFRQPLSVFLLRVGGENMALGFACSVLFMIPVLFLHLLFEEQLVEGIVRSEIK